MYKRDVCFKSIVHFKATNELLVTYDSNNQVTANDISKELKITNVNLIEIFNHKIYLSSLKGEYCVFDYELNILDDTGTKLFYPINDEFLGLQYLDSNKNIQNALINNRDTIIELTGLDKTGNYLVTNGESIFYSKRNKVFGEYFLTTSETKWTNTVELISHDAIISLIDILNGILFIYTKGNKILIVNAKSGEISHVLNGPSQIFGESNIDEELRPYPFFRTKYLLNEDKTCIYGLAMDLFYELKVENNEVISVAYSLKKEFDRLGINHWYISKNNVLHGKHFYFMLEDLLRFAVLDVETKEIVFLSDEIGVSNNQGAFTKLKEIQITESKAYVLASDNVLYVFNKV